MKVYKGTNKDMKCRGFQYKLGETAVFDGEPHLCKAGLHACEQPIKENHATGYWGAASATGYRGAASATGDQGAASATGKAGVALAPAANARQWAHSAARSAASSAASGTEIHIRSLLSRQRLSMAKRSSLILGIGCRTANLWRWSKCSIQSPL